MKRSKKNTVQPIQTGATAFKNECIAIIGTAIAQRRVLIAKGESPFALNLQHRQVISQYEAYKFTWSVWGIARFMIKYGNAVLQMIPWTNGPAVIRCKQLIETSKKMIHVA
jgi:hypothetical protein